MDKIDLREIDYKDINRIQGSVVVFDINIATTLGSVTKEFVN
jgi:hypothetical protein